MSDLGFGGGVDSGSGFIDGSGFGNGYCWCDESGVGYGYGTGHASGMCDGAGYGWGASAGAGEFGNTLGDGTGHGDGTSETITADRAGQSGSLDGALGHEMSELIGKMVLARDNRAGVHVGTLVSLDLAAKTCELSNARKVWYWVGAASCHGIAAKGLNHDGSKVCPVVGTVLSCDVVEIVECSSEGSKSVMEAPEWTP